MKLPAPGGVWRLGQAPALLTISLNSALVAALRGLDYLDREGAGPGGILSLVEGTAPPRLWAVAFLGSAVVVLLGIGGRWPGVTAAGHLGIAATYAGLGLPVLAAAYTGPTLTLLAALGAGAVGLWALLSPRAPGGLPARLLAVVILAGVAAALTGVLAPDYRTGSGMVGGAVTHMALAFGFVLNAMRTSARAEVEEEVTSG